MNRAVVLAVLFACSRGEAPPDLDHTAATSSSASAGWVAASFDGVFSIETPVASTPNTANPHSWSADPRRDLSFLFNYLDLPHAPDQLDGAVSSVTTGLEGKPERIESTTVLGRPARQIWGTTHAKRPARILFVADSDRLFMLQVIGTTNPAEIDRFFGSLKIR